MSGGSTGGVGRTPTPIEILLPPLYLYESRIVTWSQHSGGYYRFLSTRPKHRHGKAPGKRKWERGGGTEDFRRADEVLLLLTCLGSRTHLSSRRSWGTYTSSLPFRSHLVFLRGHRGRTRFRRDLYIYKLPKCSF